MEEFAIITTALSILTSGFLLHRNRRLFLSLRSLNNKAILLESEKSEALKACSRARIEARQACDRMVVDKMNQYHQKFNKDSADIVSQAIMNSTFNELIGNLRGLVEYRSSRIHQAFMGSINDEAESLIRELNIELSEKIWDAFQGYKEIAKESPYIFPDGTKIAYTKGDRTVIVIEQKPHVRTVTFDGALVKSRSVAEQAQSRTESGYRFTLAFPYVYFIIAFDHSRYAFHEIYFRNSPLTSIREYVSPAPIPNVYRNSIRSQHICMGEGFLNAEAEEQTVARKAELVVADFWQRTFSNDLGNGEPEKVDKRIANYGVWQQNTENDPLFVLNIKWPKGRTIKGVVEDLLDKRERNSTLDPADNVIKTKLEEGVAKLTSKIKEEVELAKQEGLKDFQLEQRVVDLLSDTLLRHTEAVFTKL